MEMLKSPISRQKIDTTQFLLMNISWIRHVCIKTPDINLQLNRYVKEYQKNLVTCLGNMLYAYFQRPGKQYA